VADSVQAYFFGTSYNECENGRPVGLSGFAIPDLGVIFRSRQQGSIYECQYGGLLALLKFIDLNTKNLSGFDFEILSDSALVVYHISHRRLISRDLAPFFNEAIDYKRKIEYRVSWVPRQENIALIGLADTPAVKPEFDIDFLFPSGNNAALL
jgi:hypothetical protein